MRFSTVPALQSRAFAVILLAALWTGAALPVSASAQGPDTTVRRIAQVSRDTANARRRDLSLDPSRSISLDTDEGSWISLDVSPDGRTIVFDLLGDLYTLPIAGGAATQLTRGMAYDAQPRFSPDGKRVVFTSDRDGGDNVWHLYLPTKRPKQITQ